MENLAKAQIIIVLGENIIVFARNRPQVNLLTCGLLLFDIQLIK